MTVWSASMRESTTWRADRATAELLTVHTAAPTSYMVPILATAWTMDNSRIRVPHGRQTQGRIDMMRNSWYNWYNFGSRQPTCTVRAVAAEVARAITL
jgi:hypothetical protein